MNRAGRGDFIKRIIYIVLACILGFSLVGCTKTYKGTDGLIEKAREEIPISDSDTADMQYGGITSSLYNDQFES